MKVLVPIKVILDCKGHLPIKPDGSGIEGLGLRLTINPVDENALDEARRLRETGAADEVIAITCGPADREPSLRAALAQGADRAILVQAPADLQPLAIARLLKAICDVEKPDLVLCGSEATDDNCGQVPAMLAALARWPQALGAARLSVSGPLATVACEVDGGLQTLEMPLPGVVSANVRLNVPRRASMASIVKAKSKPIQVLTAASLGVDLAVGVKTEYIRPRPERFEVEPSLPPFPWIWSRQRRTAGVRLTDSRELAQVLRRDLHLL